MDYKEKVIALLNSQELSKEQKEKLEEMFPELKEESESERIVKELLTFFRESIHGGHILTNKEYDSWIAWLEKQGEQKPANTDFSDLRTWKYIVDAVLTERNGIGQYLNSPFTEEVANKLQKKIW